MHFSSMVFNAPPVKVAKLKKSGHSVKYYSPPKIDVPDELKSRKTRHIAKNRKRNIWKRQTYTQEAINKWKQAADFKDEPKIRTERVRREPTIFDDIPASNQYVNHYDFMDAASVFSTE